MAELYRKSSLEKLSSPEQLDRMIVITPPTFWLAMLGAGAIIVTALLWSIFGRLPVSVKGEGIFISNEGVRTVYSDTVGMVASMEVEPGQEILKGDVVAYLTNPDAQAQLNQLNDRIEAVKAVTLTSTGDTVNTDTKDLVGLKSSIDEADAQLLQAQSSRDVWSREYSAESAKLRTMSSRLESAKAAYYAAMDSVGGSSASAQMRVDTAAQNCQAAEAAVSQLVSTRENAKAQLMEGDALNGRLLELEANVQQTYNVWQGYIAGKPGAEADLANAQNELDAAIAALEDAKANGGDVDTAEKKVKGATDERDKAKSVVDELPALITKYEGLYLQAQAKLEQFKADQEAFRQTIADAEIMLPEAEAARDQAFAELEQAKAELEAVMNSAKASETDMGRKQIEYQEASQAYAAQQGIVTGLEQNLAAANAQIAAANTQASQQSQSAMKQFEATKDAVLSALDLEVQNAEHAMKRTEIRSQVSGTVVELAVDVGAVVGQGSEVVRLTGSQDAENVVVCYVPLQQGKKLTAGMPVMLYPSTVNKQEYGHMEAVTLSVDDYVTSAAKMKNDLSDENLVRAFTQNGPVIAVTCEIKEDPNTESGFFWSSRKGSSVVLAEGTLMSADIVTERKAPIKMVIPLIKGWFSMKDNER